MHFACSLFVSFASWVVLLVSLLLFAGGNLGGISAMPLAYFWVCILQSFSVIYQQRSFEPKEIAVWSIITFLYIANGVAYLIFRYGKKFKTFTLDAAKKPKE
jgi:uncharacterized membrane protein YedE/YeeE